jgi:AraC-like DNA-binding protein
MANCDTVGDALATMCRYHDVAADAVRPRCVMTKAALEITWEVLGGAADLPRHMAEAVASSFALTVRRLAGRSVDPTEAWFSHPSPENTDEHELIFNCPVSFDRPRTTLLYDTAVFDLPVVMPDRGLRETLVTYLDESLKRLREPETFSAQVFHILGSLLPGTPPSLARVAQRMGVSPRTIQGRLMEEGTSFRELADGIRRELSLQYLKNAEYSINDVAFLLGYAEQSAFTRAFRRWTGTSPGAYRDGREKGSK